MAGDGGAVLFSVVSGLGASGFGWVVATNFRGAADRLHRMSQQSGPFGRGKPAPLGVGFVRAIAGVFAVAGPIFLITGTLGLAKGYAPPADFPDLPLFMDVAMSVVTLVSLWTLWRRSGMLRREWDAGGGLQRTACAVATAALVGLPLTMAWGDMTLMHVDWLVGGIAIMVLLVSGRSDDGRDSEAAEA